MSGNSTHHLNGVCNNLLFKADGHTLLSNVNAVGVKTAFYEIVEMACPDWQEQLR